VPNPEPPPRRIPSPYWPLRLTIQGGERRDQILSRITRWPVLKYDFHCPTVVATVGQAPPPIRGPSRTVYLELREKKHEEDREYYMISNA
jgi:hypothetical protein